MGIFLLVSVEACETFPRGLDNDSRTQVGPGRVSFHSTEHARRLLLTGFRVRPRQRAAGQGRGVGQTLQGRVHIAAFARF